VHGDSNRGGTAPTGALDEVAGASGEAAARYRTLLDGIRSEGIERAAARARDRADELGLSFRSADGRGEFALDPVPRLVAGDEWARLRAGLSQRAAALNAFIIDAYGERRIVAAGRVPAHVLDSADHYEPQLAGAPLGAWPAVVVGFDLVRDADGRLLVLEDNLRTPSGIAYALAARTAVDEALPLEAPGTRLDPEAAVAMLAAALKSARGAPHDGVTVLLSEGEHSGARFEHVDLARRLGIEIATPGQLVRRGERLAVRLEAGERELSVIYRRTDEDGLRDDRGRATWLQELLLEPVLAGSVTVVNAIGAGVADDKLSHAYVEQMIAFYLGEAPILGSVRTHDLSREEIREEMLQRLDEIVIKPRSSLGGAGVLIGRHASAGDRDRVAREVRGDPGAWIAQEMVALSTHPTAVGDALEPRHIDLRAYAIAGAAAPVALTRFARRRGELVVNSSEGGGAKDTWILS
jgi:uncharacterized circularly permuted ATP-grasp superfamily protein